MNARITVIILVFARPYMYAGPYTGEKQNANSYRPIFLLTVWGKVIEKIIKKEKSTYFIDNKLISSNQSRFKPGDP